MRNVFGSGRMSRRAALKGFAGIFIAAGFTENVPAWGEDTVPGKLTPAEKRALQKALFLIRGCCKSDGAIRMNSATTIPALIRPYFGHYAALALLVANPFVTPTEQLDDLKRVAKWLDWCATRQKPDTGYLSDFLGIAPGVMEYEEGLPDIDPITMKPKIDPVTNKVIRVLYDSVDSYAALFLMVADRYQQIITKQKDYRGDKDNKKALDAILNPEKLLKASQLALKAIESMVDNGLTWAKPGYLFKLLMDNVEVHGGLVAGVRFFTATQSTTEADTARKMAEATANKLPKYWQKATGRFAVSLEGIDNYGIPDTTKRAPDGLANLFGLAYIPQAASLQENVQLWDELQKGFPADPMSPNIPAGVTSDSAINQQAPDAMSGHWLAAATSIGSEKAISEWRKKVVEEIEVLEVIKIGVHVPALAVLALLEGARWMNGLPK